MLRIILKKLVFIVWIDDKRCVTDRYLYQSGTVPCLFDRITVRIVQQKANGMRKVQSQEQSNVLNPSISIFKPAATT